jgi:hypothetical protein
MKIQLKKVYVVLIVFSILLGACRAGQPEATATPQPQAILTAAAETANAQLTQNAQPTVTASLTASPTISSTTLPPSLTEVGPGSLTQTVFPTALPSVSPGGSDQAELWQDVTVPDGTVFKAGESFTKVWKVKNIGTSTWTPGYSLAFFGGAQMSAPTSVQLTSNVPPGQTVDISVNLVAPATNGNYRGYWKMRNSQNQFFDYAMYVEINVQSGKPAGTVPPTTPGAGKVSGLSLQVDDASPSGCPHTFTFTGSFTLSESAQVTYQLEAGSNTPGFTFNLPPAQTTTFDKGSHSVQFYLIITDAVDGWAEFHVLSPNDASSNSVSFTLKCNS